MQGNKQDKTDNLKYLIVSRELLKEYEDITLTTAFIYSYMLARYRLFSGKQSKFYESIESIADNSFCSAGSVKTALKDLERIGLLKVSKLPGAKHFKNCYIVIDKYSLYGIKQVEDKPAIDAPKKVVACHVDYDSDLPPWERF